MRILFISLSEFSTLYREIADVHNGGKFFHTKSCAAVKHPKSVTRSIIPHCSYLVLTESHMIQPFLVFCTNTLLQETISKLQYTVVNLEEAANIRQVSNTTPHEKLEHEV